MNSKKPPLQKTTATQVDLQALKKADEALGNRSRNNPDQIPSSPVKKNPVHSMITTLPVIMLVAGLWFYYASEKKQRTGAPIAAQMQKVDGVFSGLSEQSTRDDAQRLLWIKTPQRLRGARLDLQQFKVLQQLQADQSLVVWMAPRVSGSNTLWAVKVEASGEVLIDELQQ